MKKMLAVGLVAAVSACGVTPRSEESAINMVELTADGTVYRVEERGPNTIGCQDYWSQFTMWDRPVFFPPTITYEDAVAVCRSREQMQTEPAGRNAAHQPDAFVRDEANASVGVMDIQAR